MRSDKGKYSRVAELVNQWLEIHQGETFDLDIICRQLQLAERENRQYVAIELARKVTQNKLEKTNRRYRHVDTNIKLINWYSLSGPPKYVNIIWPRGRGGVPGGLESIGGMGGKGEGGDNSKFGFDGHICVSPKDIIVIAGVSNMGKTLFCLNFLWENMDAFPCTLMGNEYEANKFARRVKRMDWKNPLKENGTPKFELIERHTDWKDIIRPDNVNIIDWINLGDNFYQIGTIIEGIQAKLNNGIALISLQKDEGRGLAVGGHFSEDLSSVYFVIDKGRIAVRKVKEWYDCNPNDDIYGFDIANGGTQFRNIRRIKKCAVCHTTGIYRGTKCQNCMGSGYVDAPNEEK